MRVADAVNQFYRSGYLHMTPNDGRECNTSVARSRITRRVISRYTNTTRCMSFVYLFPRLLLQPYHQGPSLSSTPWAGPCLRPWIRPRLLCCRRMHQKRLLLFGSACTLGSLVHLMQPSLLRIGKASSRRLNMDIGRYRRTFVPDLLAKPCRVRTACCAMSEGGPLHAGAMRSSSVKTATRRHAP